jgi:hypothetical protein
MHMLASNTFARPRLRVLVVSIVIFFGIWIRRRNPDAHFGKQTFARPRLRLLVVSIVFFFGSGSGAETQMLWIRSRNPDARVGKQHLRKAQIAPPGGFNSENFWDLDPEPKPGCTFWQAHFRKAQIAPPGGFNSVFFSALDPEPKPRCTCLQATPSQGPDCASCGT